MLADHGLTDVPFSPYWQGPRRPIPSGRSGWCCALETGFETDQLAVISETDILGPTVWRGPGAGGAPPTSWPRPRP